MSDRDSAEAGYVLGGRYVEPVRPTVVVDDNPEVGRLYGPDGRLARIVRAKPERQIGFRARGNHG